MKGEKFKIGLWLFVIGLIGVLSLLLTDIPFDQLPLPEEALKELESIPAIVLKLLMLINPTILLVIFVIIGTVLYKKVNLKVPIIEGLVKKENLSQNNSILKSGIVWGIIAGILMMVLLFAIKGYLPEAYLNLGEKFKLHVLTRFLYGGITEELIMRFGLMTFLVWLISLVSGHLNARVYWIAIIVAALLFGLGHFPIVFMMVKSPSFILLSFILFANMIGGIIFGWLYWKKGLEAAIVGHIFAHVAMLAFEQLM